jgi:hypothetical protein
MLDRRQFSSQEERPTWVTVLRQAFELVYAFSVYPEALEILKQGAFFEGISTFIDLHELSPQLIRLFYQCSFEGSVDVFRRDKVVEMLIAASTIECPDRIAVLIILAKLSTDREMSLSVVKSSLFTTDSLKSMFIHATTIVCPWKSNPSQSGS